MYEDESDYEAKLATQFSEAFSRSQALHDALLTMLKDTWKVPGHGLNELAIYTVIGLLVKAAKTQRAIQHVAAKGLGQDAMILVRAQYETSVAIHFILQRNHRHRAAMYHAHAASRRLQMLQQWQKTKGLKRHATKKTIRAAQADLARWTSLMKKPPTDVSKHWSGSGGLEGAARKISRKDANISYNLFYRHVSHHAHGSDFVDHVYVGPDGLVFKLYPGDAHVASALGVADLVLWSAMNRVNKRFELGHDALIASLKPTLKRGSK